MSWHREEFDAICLLLEEWWPGEFPDARREAWRLGLDDLEPQQAMGALQRLKRRGQRFRPSVAEVFAAANVDPAAPSWPEAEEAIFGRGGILAARPARRRFESERRRAEAERDAVLDRAAGTHPLIAAFVAVKTPERLRHLPVNDPDEGGVVRGALRKEWAEFVDRAQARQAEGLPLITPALVGRLAAGPRRVNALAALDRAPTEHHEPNKTPGR